MAWLLPQLPPSFDAALRDAAAKRVEARIAAAKRLSFPEEGREDDARAALVKLCEDTVPMVRMEAVRSLGDVGGGLDALVPRVDDEDARVRELAVISLAETGDAARDALIGELRSLLRQPLGLTGATDK